MEPTDEPVELVERVAALDLGKAALVACVRVSHEDRPGRRRQEIREYSTLSRSLLELADWLRCERIELVAMEATCLRGAKRLYGALLRLHAGSSFIRR